MVLAAQQVRAGQMLAHAGTLTRNHLTHAANVRASLPESLVLGAREPLEAGAIVCAMLLSADANTRAIQLQQLAQQADDGLLSKISQWRAPVGSLEPRLKLPLIDLSLPALRRLSREQYDAFTANLKLLIESDRQIELFEYMVQRLVVRHLDPHFAPAKRAVIQYYSFRAVEREAEVLLSALARAGHTEEGQMQSAFAQGVAQLRLATSALQLLDVDRCELTQIDPALNRLAQASPAIKKAVLNACAHTIAADNVIEITEAELLRAIADTLECPVPPFIDLGGHETTATASAG